NLAQVRWLGIATQKFAGRVVVFIVEGVINESYRNCSNRALDSHDDGRRLWLPQRQQRPRRRRRFARTDLDHRHRSVPLGSHTTVMRTNWGNRLAGNDNFLKSGMVPSIDRKSV